MTNAGNDRTIKLTLSDDLYEALRERAEADHRSVARYVEHLIRRELVGAGEAVPTVTAPEGLQGLRPIAFDGEDPSRAKRREAVIDAILATDVPRSEG